MGDDKVTVLDAGRTDETDLEFQRSHETRSFVFCTEVYLSMSFYFVLETNRKQTTCTNQFSMFFFVKTTVRFSRSCCEVSFGSVKRHPVRDACATAHFSSQGGSKEPSLVQTRVKAKDRKQAQTLLFPSVRWSKSWNLRETDSVFEWKVFFSCVVGFFALAADPRVFRVASRK